MHTFLEFFSIRNWASYVYLKQQAQTIGYCLKQKTKNKNPWLYRKNSVFFIAKSFVEIFSRILKIYRYPSLAEKIISLKILRCNDENMQYKTTVQKRSYKNSNVIKIKTTRWVNKQISRATEFLRNRWFSLWLERIPPPCTVSLGRGGWLTHSDCFARHPRTRYRWA